MKTLHKFGGFAALYLAAAYLIGMVLFLVMLHTPSITDPAQRVALLVDKSMVIFAATLIMYVQLFVPDLEWQCMGESLRIQLYL